MRFNYRKINLAHPFSNKKYILRPIIPISLEYKSSSVRFEALIDSGADFSIFPMEIAYRLNISTKESKRISFSGVGGGLFGGIIVDTYLRIGADNFQTKAVFTEAKENTGILGQNGFFDIFVVKFDLLKKEIELTAKKLN